MKNISINIPKWGIIEETGYTPKTTFWSDFSIADRFGSKAVKDTYNRARVYAEGDAELMAELTLVLNHKIWQWYNVDNDLSLLYNNIWSEYDQYAYDSLDEEGRSIYFHIVD